MFIYPDIALTRYSNDKPMKKNTSIVLLIFVFLTVWGAQSDIAHIWTAPVAKQKISTNLPPEIQESTSFATALPPDCGDLILDIGASAIYPCESAQFTLQVCNEGTEDALTSVGLILDDIYTVTNISVPFTSVGNDFVLNLGSVSFGSCASVNITVDVSCAALPNRTYCAEAEIVSGCDIEVPNGVQIITDIECEPDGITFSMTNIGTETWSDVSAIVIQDEVLLISIQGDTFNVVAADIVIQDEVLLNIGTFDSIPPSEILSFFVPTDLDVFLQLQTTGIFGGSATWSEGCNPDIASGFPLQYWKRENVSTRASECREIDEINYPSPIKMLALPQGFAPPHYIEQNVGIEYKILFSLEDPGATANLIDIMPPTLDWNTVELGASSHPYIATQSNETLQFNIDTGNESVVNGFIQFYVEQMPDVPVGTVITNTASLTTETEVFNGLSYFHTISAGVPQSIQTNNYVLNSITPSNLNVCGDVDTITVFVENQNILPAGELEVHVAFPNENQGIIATELLPHPNVYSNNIGGSEPPIFIITELLEGEMLEFQFIVQANCDIITFAEENPVAIDFSLNWNDDTAILATHTSTDNADNAPINIIVPNLLLDGFVNQEYTGVIGETFTRVIRLENTSAQSYSDGFELSHFSPVDLTIDSISTGTINVNNDTLIYQITAGDIAQFGNNDSLFTTGEIIEIIETVTITGCEDLTSVYELTWGCENSPEPCDVFSFGADVLLANGTPIVDVAVDVTPEDFLACAGPDNPMHITYTFVNNGTEDLPGAGTAFFSDIRLGRGVVSGGILPYSTLYYGWDNFTINGVEAPVSETIFGNCGFVANGIYFSYLNENFTEDIDGQGGLIDQDGDGSFFELTVGDSLVFEFDIWVLCDEEVGTTIIHDEPCFYLDELECNTQIRLTAGGRHFFYESQCGEEFVGYDQYEFQSARLNFGSELNEFPTDVNANEVFNISYTVGEELRNFNMCPEDSLWIEFELPAGFSIVESGTYMIETYNGGTTPTGNTIENATPPLDIFQSGNLVRILLAAGRPSPEGDTQDYWQYLTNLQFIYEPPPGSGCGSTFVPFELFSYANCASCDDCVAHWVEDCQDIPLQTHNPDGCDGEFPGGGFGMRTVDFTLERINYDPYQDHLDSIPTDPNTYNRKAGIPGDTVRAHFPAFFLGDAITEYDSIMVEVCYEHALRGRWLEFMYGETRLISGDGSFNYTHSFETSPFESGTEIDYNDKNRCYLFNISDAVPTDYTAQNGDSLYVDLDFKILPQECISGLVYNNTGGRDPIDDWTGYVYLAKDNNIFSTDIYGNTFEFSQSFLTGNGQAPVDNEVCGEVSWHYGVNQNWVCSHGNSGSTELFPYEFRQEGVQDSIVVIVPENWEITNTEFILSTKVTAVNLDGTLDAGGIVTYQEVEPEYSETYDGKEKLTFRNGQDGVIWQPFELYTENQWKQAIQISMKPNCAVPATQTGYPLDSINTMASTVYFREFPGKDIEFSDSGHSSRHVRHTPPTFELSSSNTLQNAVTESVCWDLELSNLNNLTTEKTWMAFESLSGDITITDLFETTNNTYGSIDLIDYESNGQTNVWAHLGELGATEKRTFKVFASYENCSLDSVRVFQSYTCGEYPEIPDCVSSETSLVINPIPSELQIEIVDAPQMPVELCQELIYELRISNINLGNANDLSFRALLPVLSSLDYLTGTSEMAFPTTENFISIPDPTVSGNEMVWNLGTSMNAPLTGLWEADSSQILVRFALKTNCPFISGDIITFFANAQNNCGSNEEAVTNSPEPISISGLESSGTTLSFSVNTADALTPCAAPALLSFQLENTGDAITIGNEELILNLPNDINWQAADLNIQTGENYLQNSNPTVTNTSALTQLTWQLNDTFAPDSIIVIQLFLQTTNGNYDCGNFDVVATLQEVTEIECVDGGVCDVSNILSNFTQNVAVDLAIPVVSDLLLETYNAGMDSVWGNYSFNLINESGGVDDNYLLSFGEVESGETIYIENLPVNLATDEMLNHSGSFKAAQNELCQLEFDLEGCMCTDFVPLIVYSTFIDTATVSICAGESYDFQGNTFTETTFFCDTLAIANSCDSILCLDLTVLDTFYITEIQTICSGEEYDFNGEMLIQTGTFCQDFTAINGCDSTHCIDLTVLDTFYITEMQTICSGEEYDFNGEMLTQMGTFCQGFTAINGCDSTHCIALTVLDTFYITEMQTICSGEEYDFNGEMLTQTGTFCQDFTAINGCDSTHCIALTVLDTFYITEMQTICAGDSLNFNNELLTQAGTYCQDFTAVNGCDSTHCIALTVLDTFYITEMQTICAGEEYDFNGEMLTQTGTFCQNLTAINGCDSTHCIALTVLDTFYITEMQTICAGEMYDFNNEILTQTGTYCQDFTAINGCDSTHCIALTVLDTFHITEIQTICAGDSLNFNGEILTQTGTYCQDFTASNNCDSTHCILLEVIDEIVTEDLFVWCAEENQEWNGTIFNESGTFIYENNEVSNTGCDSTHFTEITVHPTPTVELTINTNTQELWLGQIVQLTAESPQDVNYVWSPSEGLSCVNCNSPTLTPQTNASYTVTVTNENGCINEAEITLTVKRCEDAEVLVPNMITPNGDGANDAFWLYEQEGLDQLTFLRVWDRWGNLVFETNNASEKWDARYQGKLVNSGVFAYHIKGICVGGEELEMQGNVTVIR